MILSVTMIQESMVNIDRVPNYNDCSLKAEGIQGPSMLIILTFTLILTYFIGLTTN